MREKELSAILQAITDFSTQLISVDSTAVYLVQEEQLYLGAATPNIPPDFPEEFRYTKLKNHPHITKALLSVHKICIISSSLLVSFSIYNYLGVTLRFTRVRLFVISFY